MFSIIIYEILCSPLPLDYGGKKKERKGTLFWGKKGSAKH